MLFTFSVAHSTMKLVFLVVLLAAPFLLAEANAVPPKKLRIFEPIGDAIKGVVKKVVGIFDRSDKKPPAPAPVPISDKDIETNIIGADSAELNRLEEHVGVEDHQAHSAEGHDDTTAHEESSGGHGFHYGHEGYENWEEDFPACGGEKQSPIDIRKDNLTEVCDGDLTPLVFLNPWSVAKEMRLVNNRHSVELTGEWAEGETPGLTGGVCKDDVYSFQQLHFHWGMDDTTGSEHTIDGKQQSLEMHMVHWNKKYGTYENCLNYEDCLVVLATMWRPGCQANQMFEHIIQHLRDITGEEAIEINIPPFPLDILNFPIATKEGYITYDGSLTTPPCLEIVRWIIATEAFTLGEEQLELLRSTLVGLPANFRGVQPLNKRKVFLVEHSEK